MFKVRILLLLLVPYWCLAQVEVKGTVKNKTEPMAFVNVFLTNSNGEIIAGSITEDDGSFSLESISGSYLLNVSFLGYKDWTKKVVLEEAPVVLGDIVLEEENNSLDEVLLVSKKRTIERKVDRLVFNLDNNIAVSGGDVMDALKVAPGIRVQGDEIVMIGKSNMNILIDGRLMQLSEDELTSYLSSIAADDIDKIEIITNPPAKYEAEGNSGLINIVYKKGVKNTWSNSTSGTYVQAKYAYYEFRNNFLYNKNKVRALLNLNTRLGDFEEIEELEVFYTDGLWQTELQRITQQKRFSGRVEFDYDISDRTSMGIQLLGNTLQPDMGDDAVTEIFNTSNTLDSLLTTKGFNKDDTYNYSANVHFITELDTLGRKISVDLDYFKYSEQQDRDFVTNSLSATNTFLNLITAQNNLVELDYINYSARIDVEHPIDKLKLSYGGKFSVINNESVPTYFDIIDDEPFLNTGLSNEFEYEEETKAIYINATRELTEKWTAQIGLRYEGTDTKGISRTLNVTNTNDYTKVFPTAYLSYKMNDDNSFSGSYGKRINRPYYTFLNPFRFIINSNMSSVGNPFLQPSFTDNIELSHTYKGKLTTNLFLSYTSDGFGPVFSVNDETNEQLITRENFNDQYNYGINQTYQLSAFSWWESQNTISLSYSESDFYNENVDAVEQNGWGFYFSTNNTFTLNRSKTLKGQINSWYNSPSKSYLFDNSEAFSIDLTLRHSMFDNNLQTTVGVYDIFDTSPVKRTFIVNDVKQTYQSFPSNRYLKISMSYKFGNKNINSKNRNSGNEEEKRRAGI
ncbi:outer membrane beta-barrel family protein [Aquimarina pacifica]|uniref:outer membrane beta-barrel family protein n=1 Tax=Aquimarina pacifica TaxID=1296415 RepID=UPI000472C52C|nr:outer membrane beta-barrel family protein [Aquimarina pacifica]